MGELAYFQGLGAPENKRELISLFSAREPAVLWKDIRRSKRLQRHKQTSLIRKLHAQAQRRHILIKGLRVPENL